MPTPFAVAANNLVTVVGASGYTAGSGVLALAAGQGAQYPALTGTQFYRITVVNAAHAYTPTATAADLTIFKATSLTTDTFHGVVAIEGTTDRNYVSGDVVDARVTAGTIGDIQTAVNGAETSITTLQGQVTALRTAGQAVLGSDYTITATNAWQNTGLFVALPAAGTYLVTYSARMVLQAVGGGVSNDAYILVKLFQTDNSTDVPGSIKMILYASPALLTAVGASTIQMTAGYSAFVTMTSAGNVGLFALRGGATPTWTVSQIQSNALGYSSMSYVRIT